MKGAHMSEKDRIIDAILEIELAMFLTVNPQPTSSCQEYPESFKLHRRAQFAPWSVATLGSYLEDLREAQEAGKNLMRQKYARMQGLFEHPNPIPLLEEIVRLKIDWQKEMFLKYPAVMKGARPLSDAGLSAQMTSFETYAREELATYSNRTLKLLHADLLSKRDQGINMSEEVYDYLVRQSGYPSLAAAECRLKQRLEPQRTPGNS
jgi:hypothetical protein